MYLIHPYRQLAESVANLNFLQAHFNGIYERVQQIWFYCPWAKFKYSSLDQFMNQFLPETMLSLYWAMVQIRSYMKVGKLLVAVHHCTWNNTFLKSYLQSKFSHSKPRFPLIVSLLYIYILLLQTKCVFTSFVQIEVYEVKESLTPLHRHNCEQSGINHSKCLLCTYTGTYTYFFKMRLCILLYKLLLCT